MEKSMSKNPHKGLFFNQGENKKSNNIDDVISRATTPASKYPVSNKKHK
jgi:hypothetical protein